MSNRLKNESSPYLLQHADNPVDWYPWGQEAFEKARAEDKPVFLSIGYFSCHWCHVMAEESFMNSHTADILNRYFVPVKVDREERPDIDSIYIEVCSALTGSAGWPLTVIMTPEQLPFFAGTYIPRENRGGQPGLNSLLLSIARMWQTQREKLLKTGDEVGRFINQHEARHDVNPDEKYIKAAVEQLYNSYDGEYGGFGTGTKFPSPQNLIFLLRYSRLSGDKKAREITEHTLRQMYRGGIFDHIGGGFCRYSTDREWLAPHFEKTLYDNALLAYTYAEAYEEGHLPLYKQVAEATLDYCLRELKADCGGFYSSQDADSDGVEGKYYLFTPEEVKNVLGEDEGRHFCECYDILKEGNFHGRSIPNLLINQRWRILPEGYDRHCEKLRAYRDRRSPLFTDRKILTSWNGLMLMALSKAARVFNSSRYLAAAAELKDYLLKLIDEDTLPAYSYQGEEKGSACLDGWVFPALGLLELSEIHCVPGLLSAVQTLSDGIIEHFSSENGGFYLNSKSTEKLIKRPMELFDGAMPSGNSACAVLFDRLYRMSGNLKWRDSLDRLLEAVCGTCGKYPAAAPFAACAVLSRVYPTRELVCVCKEPPEAMDRVLGMYSPELTVIFKTPELQKELSAFAPFTEGMEMKDGRAALYICSNGSCGAPIIIE